MTSSSRTSDFQLASFEGERTVLLVLWSGLRDLTRSALATFGRVVLIQGSQLRR